MDLSVLYIGTIGTTVHNMFNIVFVTVVISVISELRGTFYMYV